MKSLTKFFLQLSLCYKWCILNKHKVSETERAIGKLNIEKNLLIPPKTVKYRTKSVDTSQNC